MVDGAAERARARLAPSDHDALDLVVTLVLGRELAATQPTRRPADDFRVRFQQTCGPVMAKGIEDTAFYRWFRLAGANEVGGDPTTWRSRPRSCTPVPALVTTWPTTMTTLSTHDTKRSEDVRARLVVLSEDGDGWATWLGAARELAAAHRTPLVDGATEYLVWQTLVGTWPITGARLEEYLQKAMREAKLHTSWIDADAAYEDEVVAFAEVLFRDGPSGGTSTTGPGPRARCARTCCRRSCCS